MWLVVVVTAADRHDAMSSIKNDVSPEVEDARDLYLALSNADAVATRTLLLEGTATGGDSAEAWDVYEEHVAEAGRLLTRLASGSDAATVERLAARLPAYAAAVDSARAYNRVGYPLASGYLRRAGSVMEDELLPDATQLYITALARLDTSGEDATTPWHMPALVVAGVVGLGVLVAVQAFLAMRFQRTLNLWLVVASVLSVGLISWTIVTFDQQADALVGAQRQGAAPGQALSTAQMLVVRAVRDDAGALIERGTGDSSFAELTGRVGGDDGSGGLLAAARLGDEARSLFVELTAAHDDVHQLEVEGLHSEAVAVFRERELRAADELTLVLSDRAADARDRFETHVNDGRDMLTALAATALVALAAAALGLIGIRHRAREYR